MPKRLLFIHHSTGGNLIHKGNLRNELYKQTDKIEFWDHGYNLSNNIPIPLLNLVANKVTFHTGLSNKEGKILGKDFNIVLGNDNPGDFENIFCSNPNENETLKQILEFDVIAFKNCFPTTKIETDEKLKRFKSYYINMAKCFEEYADKLFIPFTPPPLREEVTKLEYAQRAKDFAKWMVTEWDKPTNVYVFDFFTQLANSSGYLKKEYCPVLKIDSHPNTKANKEVAIAFVDFIKGLNV